MMDSEELLVSHLQFDVDNAVFKVGMTTESVSASVNPNLDEFDEKIHWVYI